MTAVNVAAAPRRRSFGKLSVQTAVGISALASVLLILFFQIPAKASWHDVAAGAVVIAVGILAPLGHLVGILLGIVSFFRTGDRPGLGVVGVLLNGLVVALGLLLIYLAASGLAPR
jgi:hypothetical protein